MTVSSIDKELIRYFVQLSEPQKKSLLQMIKAFIKSDEEHESPISIEQYNKELDDAMIRINEGNFTTLEELQKEMRSW
ncbi:MAG TPA: hypothetical protein VIJ95_03450 [Hanamia sp.]